MCVETRRRDRYRGEDKMTESPKLTQPVWEGKATYCKRCHAVRYPDANFCGDCGARLVPAKTVIFVAPEDVSEPDRPAEVPGPYYPRISLDTQKEVDEHDR